MHTHYDKAELLPLRHLTPNLTVGIEASSRQTQRLLRYVSVFGLNILGGLYVSGTENLDQLGECSLVVAPNHSSYLDGPAVGAAVLTLVEHSIISEATTSVLVMRNLIDKAGPFEEFARVLYGSAGFLPVNIDDNAPLGATRELIRHMTKVRKDQKLGISHVTIAFPEGQRNDQLGDLKNGVITIATKTGSLIVPTGISGPSDIMPKGTKLPRRRSPTVIHFGTPVDPSADSFDDPLAELRAGITAATNRANKVRLGLQS